MPRPPNCCADTAAPWRRAITSPNRSSPRRCRPSSTSLRAEQLRHPRYDRLQALERPDHHLERDDLAVLAPVDHVDTVDHDAVEGGLELQDRRVVAVPLFDVVEVGAAEEFRSGVEVLGRGGLALLRGEDRR